MKQRLSSRSAASANAYAKALGLVNLHHAPPLAASTTASEGEPVVLSREGNHLRAKQRVMKVEEIPLDSLPAILQVSNGQNFVILKERLGGDRLLVQFPDSRECEVSLERLNEVYDGRCILLKARRRAARKPFVSRLLGLL